METGRELEAKSDVDPLRKLAVPGRGSKGHPVGAAVGVVAKQHKWRRKRTGNPK